MEHRELALDALAADEPETLHGFQRSRGLADFAASGAKARKAIGTRARRGLGGLQERAGQRAPKLIDEGCVSARDALHDLLAEH